MRTEQHERTLVLLKPDAVQRGLIGEIIKRFELRGLKIVGMKMVQPDKKMALSHYDMPLSDKQALGKRTKAAYEKRGEKNDKTPVEIADDIIGKLVYYITTGPIVALAIEGAHAIQLVRKIRGATNPLDADLGSIAADLTIDSYFIADAGERAVRNLVHASGSSEEAERELNLWFEEKELMKYDLAIEKILYDTEWEHTREELTKSDD